MPPPSWRKNNLGDWCSSASICNSHHLGRKSHSVIRYSSDHFHDIWRGPRRRVGVGSLRAETNKAIRCSGLVDLRDNQYGPPASRIIGLPYSQEAAPTRRHVITRDTDLKIFKRYPIVICKHMRAEPIRGQRSMNEQPNKSRLTAALSELKGLTSPRFPTYATRGGHGSKASWQRRTERSNSGVPSQDYKH